MSDPSVEHISGGKTGRDVLQDEKHVSNRPTGEGPIRPSG